MGYADKATVLVVDDDAGLRLMTAEMLVENGYQAIEAAGASEAIDLLSRHDVDVLLTDIHMPGLSGFALAEQAKRLKPDLLVIFATGFISQSMWDQRRSDAVLHKPYSGRQLLTEITRLTGVNLADVKRPGRDAKRSKEVSMANPLHEKRTEQIARNCFADHPVLL